MNIDEFLDSVASQNLSKTPIISSATGVNAVPPDALVRNVMNSKFDAIQKTQSPSSNIKNESATQTSTSSLNSASTASVVPQLTNTELVVAAVQQFESQCVALETSLACAEYQHAFDTYIALQSTLAHLHEQQKKQQRLFQDRLNQFKTRLFNAVQESTTQFQSVMQELYIQIGQIKQLVDSNQIDAATTQYRSVKQTIEQLPNNFSDKKEKLQDELLKVYLYLKDKSETHTANSFTEIATSMKQLYVSAVAAIKVGNFSQAQQLYEQLAAKYALLPDGFTEQKVQLFDYVTFLHSQLTLDLASTQNSQLQASSSYNSPAVSAYISDSFSPRISPINSNKLSQKVDDNLRSSLNPHQENSSPLKKDLESIKSPILKRNESQIKSEPIPDNSQEPKIITADQNVVKVSSNLRIDNNTSNSGFEQNSQEKNEAQNIAKLLQSVPKPQSLETNSLNLNVKKNKTQTVAQPLVQPNLVQSKSPQSQLPLDSKLVSNVSKKSSAQFAPIVSKSSSSKEIISPKLENNSKDDLTTQSASQLQERAKKLAARLAELKSSLEN